jgi:tRNA pseudouridine38-40 synthase
MARYQLLIEYVGTDFRGWQIQKKGSTIQGLIQEKLTKLLKEKIILNGSGRTDTGVHAIEQSGHFDSKNEIIDLTKFLKSINHFLNDKGVAIKKIRKRSNKFHSRFSAKQRVYKYIIFNQISAPVIEKKRGWHVRKPLDLDLIKKGAKKLVGTHDYSTLDPQVAMQKVQLKQLNRLRLNHLKIKLK